MEINKIFEGLQIVEFASVLAGPLVGSFFAELGAKVTKIENKRTGGDVTRRWLLPSEDKEYPVSAYYCAANFGKSVVLLDLRDPKDYYEAMSLVAEADVAVLNLKPGDADKLNLDYHTLKKTRRDIIYACLTGFGSDDSRPAFDVVLQAETGFLSMTGEPGRMPVKMPVALIDVIAAHHMKEAILCALIKRMRTGEGSYIEISLYEAALASLANQATNWLMAGHIAGPMGTRHPNIAPYGDLFTTSDGKHIVLAIGTDRQFMELAQLLAIDAMGFEKNVERVRKRDQLTSALSTAIGKHSLDHLSGIFDDAGVPYGRIRNLREVLDDPMAEKMKLCETIEGLNTIRMRTALL